MVNVLRFVLFVLNRCALLASFAVSGDLVHGDMIEVSWWEMLVVMIRLPLPLISTMKSVCFCYLTENIFHISLEEDTSSNAISVFNGMNKGRFGKWFTFYTIILSSIGSTMNNHNRTQQHSNMYMRLRPAKEAICKCYVSLPRKACSLRHSGRWGIAQV